MKILKEYWQQLHWMEKTGYVLAILTVLCFTTATIGKIIILFNN